MYFYVTLMHTNYNYNKQNLNVYLGSKIVNKCSTIRTMKTIIATLDELLKTFHIFYNIRNSF